MKLVSAILSAVLVMGWPSIGTSEESGDILDFLPAIIATSALTCDLDKLSTCKTESICTRSGGHWYSSKCNLDPYGLMLVTRLAGTWDFYHRSSQANNSEIDHTVVEFSVSTIKPIGNKGDYEIEGKDVTYSSVNRNVTATYRTHNDLMNIFFAQGLWGNAILIPEYWYLDFVSSRELTGWWTPIFNVETQAWATKR